MFEPIFGGHFGNPNFSSIAAQISAFASLHSPFFFMWPATPEWPFFHLLTTAVSFFCLAPPSCKHSTSIPVARDYPYYILCMDKFPAAPSPPQHASWSPPRQLLLTVSGHLASPNFSPAARYLLQLDSKSLSPIRDGHAMLLQFQQPHKPTHADSSRRTHIPAALPTAPHAKCFSSMHVSFHHRSQHVTSNLGRPMPLDSSLFTLQHPCRSMRPCDLRERPLCCPIKRHADGWFLGSAGGLAKIMSRK